MEQRTEKIHVMMRLFIFQNRHAKKKLLCTNTLYPYLPVYGRYNARRYKVSKADFVDFIHFFFTLRALYTCTSLCQVHCRYRWTVNLDVFYARSTVVKAAMFVKSAGSLLVYSIYTRVHNSPCFTGGCKSSASTLHLRGVGCYIIYWI